MSNFSKRLLALMLALVMVFCLSACGSDSDTGSGSNNDYNSNNGSNNGSNNDSNNGNNNGNNGGTAAAGKQMEQGTKLTGSDLRYVMIYNPKVYNENKLNAALSVGALGSQIDVYADRGDGLETEGTQYNSISAQDWMQFLPEDMQLEGDRADVMGVDYKLGDTQSFYYSANPNSDLQTRAKGLFTCKYAGEYCYIWTIDNSVAPASITELGREFDQKIYGTVTSTFGKPRFVGETGKVNLLVYDLSGGLMGYFATPDLFTQAELPLIGLDKHTCNTGHAIVNINASLLKSNNRVDAYSTVAHELQHLINFSAFFDTVNGAVMNTWLNEAMSGYIETELYANAKESSGHFKDFNESARIRNGQSLYNFDTTMSYFDFDIGVYGSVYYFSKYLEMTAGKNVFSNMMDYWRESFSGTLNTSEALAKGVSASVYDKINRTIDYTPLNIRFDSASDEWMSKLCLDFYLTSLAAKSDAVFRNIDRNTILFDSMDGATIEGGGRIIVALSGDTFDIPANSDKGLIYVGLDENFKPVTNFIYQ